MHWSAANSGDRLSALYSYSTRRRRIVTAPSPMSRPSAIIRPVLDIVGAGAVADVQTSSMQTSGRAHCEVVMHEPPAGTGVLVGVAVTVAVAVGVGPHSAVDAVAGQKPLSWSCFSKPVSRKYLQKKSLGTI
jgi:hypothetical protein